MQPDIVALGKGLGNGYPVSVVAMTPAVARGLATCGFHHAQSHQNDPLACAVAREVLAVIQEENFIQRACRVGGILLRGLTECWTRHASVREVRGRGLMIGMEFHEDPHAAFHALVDRGYLCGYKPAARLLRFYPPLTIPEEDCSGLVAAIDEVLS